MDIRNIQIAIAVAVLAGACTSESADQPQPQQRRPQQAGQALDPVKAASHVAAMRVASMTGNQEATRQNLDVMHKDLMRAMKLADAGRPINREAARAIARDMSGVRSANWIDRHNLMVRVEGAELRSNSSIDELCIRLEPLGDTLAVVVHLQDAAATTHDGMDTLSRNCQLAPGEQALFQRNHQVDALDPALRAQYRATAARTQSAPQRKQTAGDQAALEAMPEM